MAEGIRHNCGFCVAHTLHDAHSIIRSLQHRGREAGMPEGSLCRYCIGGKEPFAGVGSLIQIGGKPQLDLLEEIR